MEFAGTPGRDAASRRAGAPPTGPCVPPAGHPAGTPAILRRCELTSRVPAGMSGGERGTQWPVWTAACGPRRPGANRRLTRGVALLFLREPDS